jgi:hypothetical protein
VIVSGSANRKLAPGVTSAGTASAQRDSWRAIPFAQSNNKLPHCGHRAHSCSSSPIPRCDSSPSAPSSRGREKRTPRKTEPAPKMDHGAQLARVRRICLSIPGTIEKISHGAPTFFTPKRVFAMFADNHHGDGHVAVRIPAGPGVQAALTVAQLGPPSLPVPGTRASRIIAAAIQGCGAVLADWAGSPFGFPGLNSRGFR